jgi:serine/threonine protein kinase
MSAEDFGEDARNDSRPVAPMLPENKKSELLTGTIGPGEAIAGRVISADGHSSNSPGTQIAAYSLVRLIGRGGMGEVWLAEQMKPVRRPVALKLIKTGMDTHEVVARFQSERQALALMDHPAIAKVFDAGATPEGRPYFVMEYVNGVPLTDYCDSHKLTARQRLELFVRICEGVQHAHQKAILHRDLKPSNILVSEVDGRPVPRIIDFGLAKATLPQNAAEAMFTQVGAIVGTPGYMSPEQADSGGADVDTRTDVYSLGVVLYELLVGALPLDFHKTPLDEFLRKLREEDSPRPSTRLRALGEGSATSAENRSADIPTLIRQLRGDLDAIALRALEKDRSRRYATPLELAADIGRYLNNEPVLARPASSAYRARKYIRRHRVGVSVAALAAALLISFAVAEMFELRRITRERDRANRERDRASRVTDFMTNMFKVSNPSEARGNTITAREILDKSAKDIETGLTNEPDVQAQMMHVMGDVFDNLGLYSNAESLVGRALEIRRNMLGPANAETLTSMHLLAYVYYDESRQKDAEKLCRETLQARRHLLGSSNRDTLESANLLANILTQEGRYQDAEKLHREVAETARQAFGQQDKLTKSATENLAIDLAQQAKYSDAEKVFREILESDKREYGPDHPDTLGDINNLAAVLQVQSQFAESAKLNSDLLLAKRRVFGPEHPSTLATMGNLALVLAGEKHYADAEKLFRDALEIKRKVLGPEHRSTLVTMGNLADVLTSEDQYSEAEPLIRQTLEIERRTLGPRHSDYLHTLDDLGRLLMEERHYVESERVLREELAGRRNAFGDQNSDTTAAAYNLACVLAREGNRDEAFTTLQFAVQNGLSSETRDDLEKDESLRSLRGDPRFNGLIASSHREAAAQK